MISTLQGIPDLRLRTSLRSSARSARTEPQTRAQGGANPDQSGALALIHVPGPGKKDFFIQLNLPRSKAGPNEPEIPADSMDAFKSGKLLALSFVSIDKSTDPKTGALWTTDELGGNRYRLQNRPADPSSCQKCHVNPLKTYSLVGYGATHGSEKAMSPQQSRSIDAMTQAMTDYGPVSWGTIEEKGQVYSMNRSPAAALRSDGRRRIPPREATKPSGLVSEPGK